MQRATWEGNDIEGMLDHDDIESFKLATFDARVFQIPFVDEVQNYFIWRQQDATRNSISSVAQSLYSHKELNGKKTDEMQEMIFQKGINWNDFDFRKKRGAVIGRVPVIMNNIELGKTYTRNKWRVVETPIFTQDKEFIKSFLPIKNC
jgi:tRNA(His) 5'-end guanylyltransferase